MFRQDDYWETAFFFHHICLQKLSIKAQLSRVALTYLSQSSRSLSPPRQWRRRSPKLGLSDRTRAPGGEAEGGVWGAHRSARISCRYSRRNTLSASESMPSLVTVSVSSPHSKQGSARCRCFWFSASHLKSKAGFINLMVKFHARLKVDIKQWV